MDDTPAPFQGEVMTCALCGKRERSDPGRSSDWRYIVADGKGHYICTDHFPPDTGTAAEFRDAYVEALTKLFGGRS